MIGEVPGGITILATHFFKLTELAKQYANRFMNYKVVAERHADGTIVRQYKIAPGISTLNIAMDLLRQEGLFAY
jgi:DNA mismatch repair ATPase MutS